MAPLVKMLCGVIAGGFEPVGSSAQEFAAYIKAETAKYAKLVHDAGLKFG